MKTYKVIFLILIVTVLAAFALPVSFAGPGPYGAVVVFEQNTGDLAKGDLIKAVGGVKTRDLDIIDAAAVSLPSKAAAAVLAGKKGVSYIEEDRIVAQALDESLPWGVDRVDADLVWPVTIGTGVKVAVNDTGIDLNHPDLAANIKGGFNTIDPSLQPQDDEGHGTHVAGTIAATAGNGIGVKGVAPGVDLYAVKVLGPGGGYLSDIIEGLDWAVANDMDVVNMSYGGPSANRAEQAAIRRAYNAGITLVAAAGNNYGGRVGYPGAYAEVIAVSATTIDNKFAFFSSKGKQVDLAAPGASIYSTLWDDTYAFMSGTSMASPHVAGVAALVISAKGPLSPAQVKQRLQSTADKLPGLTTNQQGAGLVDADEAALAP